LDNTYEVVVSTPGEVGGTGTDLCQIYTAPFDPALPPGQVSNYLACSFSHSLFGKQGVFYPRIWFNKDAGTYQFHPR
jgi:hypothetical protein